MKNPSKEWLKVCDLMVEMEKRNLNISLKSESFIEGLYQFLDPYEPFIDQLPNDGIKQKKWLNDLWGTYCDHDSTEINIDCF